MNASKHSVVRRRQTTEHRQMIGLAEGNYPASVFSVI